MLRRLGSLILLTSLIWAPGCAYFQTNPPLEPAPAEARVTADLPVPEGFQLDRNSSYRHERSTYRRLKLVYRAEEYLGEERTRQFCEKAFIEAGWNIAFIYGLETTKMILARGAEECRILIWEDFGDRFTQLEVEVEPRQTPEGDLVGRQGWSELDTGSASVGTTPASAPKPKGALK